MLIYQVDNGGNNSGKKPSGGVIAPATVASSMSATIANPITIYWGDWNTVISQTGQSGDLYNYYWTSYSRGTDGQWDDYNWHNLYLDSYIPLRYKSIYDPCPYGYRIPSNGTYNEFRANAGWALYSYIGGIATTNTWIAGSGYRTTTLADIGGWLMSVSATISSDSSGYVYAVVYTSHTQFNRDDWSISVGNSVRCIEECEILTEATEASVIISSKNRF